MIKESLDSRINSYIARQIGGSMVYEFNVEGIQYGVKFTPASTVGVEFVTFGPMIANLAVNSNAEDLGVNPMKVLSGVASVIKKRFATANIDKLMFLGKAKRLSIYKKMLQRMLPSSYGFETVLLSSDGSDGEVVEIFRK